jgi:hypothetical protein
MRDFWQEAPINLLASEPVNDRLIQAVDKLNLIRHILLEGCGQLHAIK